MLKSLEREKYAKVTRLQCVIEEYVEAQCYSAKFDTHNYHGCRETHSYVNCWLARRSDWRKFELLCNTLLRADVTKCIRWTDSFLALMGAMVFHDLCWVSQYLTRISLASLLLFKLTLNTLIRRHFLWFLVWVCTVCLSHIKRTLHFIVIPDRFSKFSSQNKFKNMCPVMPGRCPANGAYRWGILPHLYAPTAGNRLGTR